MNSTNTMEPLIIKDQINGASVKTIHNQFISYILTYHSYIYPYHGIFKIQNGEYFIINIPTPTYHKLVKGLSIPIPINSIEDINLLKYLINKLY